MPFPPAAPALRRRVAATALPLVLGAGCSSGAEGRPGSATLAGRWTGAIEHRGATLEAVMDMHPDPLRAVLAAPQQLTLQRPVRNLRYDPPRLRFEAEDGEQLLAFDGRHEGPIISGTMRGGDLSARLTLRRVGEVPAPAFSEEEVRIPADGATLAGTLLVPRRPGPYPAVLFLHGSGPGLRSSLRALAEAFATRGIAALIYDKRGDGASTGDWRSVPFTRLADDALSAVRYLRGRTELPIGGIGIWGGSEGGLVAPMVAVRAPEIGFLILVSTLGVTAAEQDVERIRRSMRARRMAPAETEEAVRLRRLAHRYLRTREGRAELESALGKARHESWFADFGDTGPVDRGYWWSWYRTKMDHDPSPVLRRLRVPTLVIFGGADLVVDPRRNAGVMQGALREAGVPHAVRVFPGADHTLRLPAGPRPDTNGRWDWPRVAPGYLDAMIQWAREHARQTAAPSRTAA